VLISVLNCSISSSVSRRRESRANFKTSSLVKFAISFQYSRGGKVVLYKNYQQAYDKDKQYFWRSKMATLESDSYFAPGEGMAKNVQATTMHPHPEGVFLDAPDNLHDLPLPSYDTEVDTSYRKSIRTNRDYGYGTTWHEEWQMSDGIRYDVLITEPEQRKTDIVVAKDTAWGTQVQGFNAHLAREMMRLGYPMVIKGPEKGGSIPLSHSAYNTHRVLDETEKIGLHESKVAAIEGYSRGAMIGFGTGAYADQHGRKIVYSNLTDPCLAHPIEFTARQLGETLSNMKDAPIEVLASAVQLGRLVLNPAKLFHYRETINLSVEGARQFYQTGKPLFTGEAGFLARHFPEDSQATICFFRNSLANHQAEFVDILKHHEGVEIKRPRGGHITGMDKRILGNIITRFSGLIRQLDAGVHHREIDYSLVHKPKV
jgi:hypothetical protein